MHEIIIIQEMINEKQKNLMKITATDTKLLQKSFGRKKDTKGLY